MVVLQTCFKVFGQQETVFWTEIMAANDNRSDLPDAAKRALAEAAARKKAALPQKEAPKEILGRDGPDPVRYGDWEKDGIISDF